MERQKYLAERWVIEIKKKKIYDRKERERKKTTKTETSKIRTKTIYYFESRKNLEMSVGDYYQSLRITRLVPLFYYTLNGTIFSNVTFRHFKKKKAREEKHQNVILSDQRKVSFCLNNRLVANLYSSVKNKRNMLFISSPSVWLPVLPIAQAPSTEFASRSNYYFSVMCRDNNILGLRDRFAHKDILGRTPARVP